jgi:ATP-dependent DNA helicase RecQ
MLTDFAEQLAQRLNIRFVEAIGVKTRPPVRIPQSEVVNTNRLAINMDGAFKALDAASAYKSPVLLVDDWVSSRWTMTFASATLRKAGVPKVYPFALAYRAAE